jgi:hypothetical protein
MVHELQSVLLIQKLDEPFGNSRIQTMVRLHLHVSLLMAKCLLQWYVYHSFVSYVILALSSPAIDQANLIFACVRACVCVCMCVFSSTLQADIYRNKHAVTANNSGIAVWKTDLRMVIVSKEFSRRITHISFSPGDPLLLCATGEKYFRLLKILGNNIEEMPLVRKYVFLSPTVSDQHILAAHPLHCLSLSLSLSPSLFLLI